MDDETLPKESTWFEFSLSMLKSFLHLHNSFKILERHTYIEVQYITLTYRCITGIETCITHCTLNTIILYITITLGKIFVFLLIKYQGKSNVTP